MSAAQPQSNADERIAKRPDASQERGSRLASDRAVTEDRDTSDSVRLVARHSMLRDALTTLPSPPPIPGYKQCWLTTTNMRDSLEQRYRRGYTLVNPNEHPGFCMPSQKSGDVTSDRITCNEMVLAKIPNELWEQDMKYLHHDMPLEQVGALKLSTEQIMKDGRGHDVAYTGDGFSNGLGDGFRQLGRMQRPANFSGVA